MNGFAPNLKKKSTKIQKSRKFIFIWFIAIAIILPSFLLYVTGSSTDISTAQKKSLPKKTSKNAIKKNSKEWKEALQKIKNSKGKGNNLTVGNKKIAKELISEALPELREYPTYSKEQYKVGFEFHPAEPAVGNDLPHIPITKKKFRFKIEYSAFGNWEYHFCEK